MNESALPLALYNLILMVVILHELCHAFTEHFFYNLVTPEGVSPTRNGGGESGWLLEARLMKERVLASWDAQGDVGRMRWIRRLVMQTESESVTSDYVISKTSFFHLKGQAKSIHRR